MVRGRSLGKAFAKGRVGALALFCFVAVNRSAWAEGKHDKAVADALFDEGKRLLKANQLAEACSKLKESERLDPGVGTLLFLGQCYEKQGKTATAWSTFREAAAAAKTAGQADRERGAREHVARLEASLSRLTVHGASDASAPGYRLELDGAELPTAIVGTPVPIDPGDHTLVATAPGHVSFRRELHVDITASNIVIDVPTLDPEAAAPPPSVSSAPQALPPPVASTPPSSPPSPAPPASANHPSSAYRTAALVTAAVGVVGLGVSGYFALSARGTYKDSRPLCNDANHCLPDGDDLVQSARSKGTAATAFLIGGLVFVGAGATLWFAAPSENTTLGMSPGSLQLKTTW